MKEQTVQCVLHNAQREIAIVAEELMEFGEYQLAHLATAAAAQLESLEGQMHRSKAERQRISPARQSEREARMRRDLGRLDPVPETEVRIEPNIGMIKRPPGVARIQYPPPPDDDTPEPAA